MHTRSLNVLSIPPLQTFALEPPAMLLPSSVSQLPPAQPALSRPSFFEPNLAQAPPQQQATIIVQSAPLQQSAPGYVPLTGTANYFFQPYLERDDKLGVCMFHSMNVRPEMSHKSPEELRLEDYNNGGVSQYVTPQAAMPGAVDMGLRGPAAVVPTFTAFTTPAPVASAFGSTAPLAFGTSTVGLFPTTQQQPSAFSAFAPPPVTQQNTFSAFGTRSSTIPQWGTATAGFGFPSTTASAWPVQQPSNVFGTLTNSTFQFPAAAPAFTSFSFTNGPFQIPTQAQFFWSTSPVETFAQFLKTLPPTISSCSFGGVQVTAPTIEECAAKIKEEKTRIAKPDADPFDLAHSLLPPPVFALEPPVVPEVVAAAPASQGGSPLKRGTSSPVLTTPTRSPLVLPQSGLHARGSSLAVPALGLGAPAISASLGTSPRLCPLPASPYLESRELSAVSVGRSVSHQGTPTKPAHPSSHHHSYSLHQMLHGVQASPRPHHQPSLSSSSILFTSQQETQSSPSRQLTTPDHHHSIVGRRLDLSGLHEVH